MATSPIPVPQQAPSMPQSNTTAAPTAMPVQSQTPPQQAAASQNAPATPTAAPAQQSNPAATQVKDKAQKAVQNLSKAVTALPRLVEQSVKQEKQQKQVRDQVTIKTVFDANNEVHTASDQIEKTKAGLQQIDQHWKEAQALPDSDPSKIQSVAYLAQMHKAAVDHLKQAMQTRTQAQQKIQGLTADKANRKILAQAFGYDEKAANSPERQYVVNLAQKQATGITASAEKDIKSLPPPVPGQPSPTERSDPQQPGSTPPSTQAGPQHTSFAHKIGTVAKTIGSIVGDILIPAEMVEIPGTTIQKAVVQRRAAALQAALADMQKTHAEADYEEASAGGIEPWQEKQKDAQAKQADAEKKEAFLEKKSSSPTAFHGKTGVMFDQSVPYGWTAPDGKQYTATDPDMPEEGKVALHDANTAYERYTKMKTQTGGAAKERADAYWGNYLLHAQGVDMKGNPLPGMMQTDTGQTVGTGAQTNVRPTGTERQRADLATSAKEQMDDMVSMVKKGGGMLGPGKGQFTDLTTWLGSQSPEAQRFKSAAVTVAGHLAGVFGGTSDAKLKDIYDVIGKYKTNPEAAIAGIEQMEKAATAIQKKGTVHTVGSSTDANKGGAPKATATGPNGQKAEWDGSKWIISK